MEPVKSLEAAVTWGHVMAKKDWEGWDLVPYKSTAKREYSKRN